MFGSFQCIKVVRIGFEVPGPVADCAAARPVLASVRFAAGPLPVTGGVSFALGFRCEGHK